MLNLNNTSILKTQKAKEQKRVVSNILNLIVRWFILLSIGYIVLYPLFYMMTASFSSRESFLDPTVVWIPKSLTLANFEFMIDVMDYGNAFWSTMRVHMVSALIEVFTCAIVAYGFSRFNFPFKRILTMLLFVTILIPSTMLIIPLMVNFSHLDVFGILGLFNKLTGIDLRPDLLGTAWTFAFCKRS